MDVTVHHCRTIGDPPDDQAFNNCAHPQSQGNDWEWVPASCTRRNLKAKGARPDPFENESNRALDEISKIQGGGRGTKAGLGDTEEKFPICIVNKLGKGSNPMTSEEQVDLWNEC